MEATSRACQWVCRRLPLLAGGELVGVDRRRVERHLISCAACRVELAGTSRSLTFLQQIGVATRRSDADDSPSLWPNLSRQIRESRRESRIPAGWAGTLTLGAGRPRLRLGLGLAAAAGMALTLGALVRPGAARNASMNQAVTKIDPPTSTIAIEGSAPAAAGDHSVLIDNPATTVAPRSASPHLPLVQAPRRPSALPDGQPISDSFRADAFESPQPLRLGFDLDRGTLSGPVGQDVQRAY